MSDEREPITMADILIASEKLREQGLPKQNYPMTLNEAFAHAIKNDTITPLEMSWSMKIPLYRLQELLEGATYTQQEELDMFRFVFKARNKRPVTNNGPIVPQPVPAPEKTNDI